MPYIIQAVAWAGGFAPLEGAGGYVDWCDVDANDGLGAFTLTDDEAKAIQFDAPGQALEFWQKQSTIKPLRDDGKPNRPLTSLTIMVVPFHVQLH